MTEKVAEASLAPGAHLSPRDLIKRQRSHLLAVFSNPVPGQESAFLRWYQGMYLTTVSRTAGVLVAQHFEQHEVDITQGQFPRLPYTHFGLYQLALDGAEEARALIDVIADSHAAEIAAKDNANWLFYPVSERVGLSLSMPAPMLTVAFSNGIPGREAEFREWYATRHIRHALKIPALVSGQCFSLTQYQHPGAMQPVFDIMAVYDQVGPPEDIIRSFSSLPKDALSFPSIDGSCFAESVFRAL
jgi:hypothetical protein